VLKRWGFWYSGVLLEHWLPGPASDWAGVLAGEKPPSRVRKKLAAAAVEAQYDAALGAGLGIPFFAKVLEWSQTGGTTLLMVSQTVRTEWEQLMRGLGDHVLDLVGHSKTAYLSLNKFFDDNVPLMSPVGQSLNLFLVWLLTSQHTRDTPASPGGGSPFPARRNRPDRCGSRGCPPRPWP
jgi:hypothetical protein